MAMGEAQVITILAIQLGHRHVGSGRTFFSFFTIITPLSNRLVSSIDDGDTVADDDAAGGAGMGVSLLSATDNGLSSSISIAITSRDVADDDELDDDDDDDVSILSLLS